MSLPRPTVLVLLAASACATVPAGYGAVVTGPFGVHAEPLGEGVSWIGPWAQADVIDLRDQEQNEDLKGVAADGAPVQANASVVTWHVVPTELVAFDREVGPDPYPRIVRPVVQAAVRRVVARYAGFALMDTRNVPDIQREVLAIAGAQLRPMHVQLDSVFLRSLVVTSAPLDAQIVATSRKEQEVLTMPHILDIERARAETRRERARAVASSNAVVGPTLTPGDLGDAANHAWIDLLSAPHTSVMIAPDPTTPLEVTP